MAGPTRASNNSPASVSDTLRVVRFIRRTPSRSSMSLSRWLRLDTETPSSVAARRKFRVRATATKASRSRRSKFFIVRHTEQAIWNCPAYRFLGKGSYRPRHPGGIDATDYEENHHGKTQTRHDWSNRFGDRPRLHGHVGLLRARRPQ